MRRALILLTLLGCESADKPVPCAGPSCDTGLDVEDRDGDGFAVTDDCDDEDPLTYPGAVEPCAGGVDRDCDGEITICPCADADGDGYPSPDDALCDADCDDSDPNVNPGELEACDEKDNDCDGEIDEAWEAEEAPDEALHYLLYGLDQDGDGYGDPAAARYVCLANVPEGYVEDRTDCDDLDASDHPGADEICDNANDDDDCDGLADDEDDSVVDYVDLFNDDDGDGYGRDQDYILRTDLCDPPAEGGWSRNHEDCDDDDDAINPAATEICDPDDTDEDCDGLTDDADDSVDAATMSVWYEDVDADGFTTDVSAMACDEPDGYSAGTADPWDDDHDDLDPDTYPGAPDYCDGVDRDGDGEVDEDDSVDALTWYADVDGDGFGDADAPLLSCYGVSGYVLDSTDCDDGAGAIWPGAEEICDGLDDDCDGDVDEEAADASTWYRDSDGDGYGWASASVESCDQPSGYVADNTDCDDTNASYTSSEIYYDDKDGDGYGDSSVTKSFCGPATGAWVPYGGDCDEDDPKINPKATETCDGIDNDCDGRTDDDDTDIDPDSLSLWYEDNDGDGFGDGDSEETYRYTCDSPSGYVANGKDCDDDNGKINPDAAETCNDADDDCDGTIDDGLATSTWSTDADGDGHGNDAIAVEDCNSPGTGYILGADDCDDTDDTVYPGATERCDGVDSDCSGEEEQCTNVSTTDIKLIPGGWTVNYTVDYPDLADDTVAFLAVGKLIEHSDDQCDFKTVITDMGGYYDFEVTLEHCGYGHYSSAYGFEATAVVLSDIGNAGGFTSFDMEQSGGGSWSDSEIVASTDASDTVDLCAVYSADGNGDVDAEWSCSSSLASSVLYGKIYGNDGSGSSWVGARYLSLGLGDNLTVDKQAFTCETNDTTVSVSHTVSSALGDDHEAIVVLQNWDADTENHTSMESECSLSGSEYTCDLICYGSGDKATGVVLFLDGDFE